MPPKVNESMQYRENRLETFQNGSFQYKSKQKRYWTHRVPDIVQLVDCGFYFTPTKINNDQITCVCCRKKETNVEGITNIADYHLTNNPSCPLALIISSQINHLSNNIQDFWRHQPSKFSNPLSKESIDLRKKTFGKHWKFDQNKASATTSTSLAKAGFYYCPLRYGNDRVQCVYCNCSLDTWLPDDIPIEEHKNNSNGPCYFLEIVDEYKPRSRSNSKSLQDAEIKQTVEKKEDNLDINRAHKTKPTESGNESLIISFHDDSMSDDSEDTNVTIASSRKKILEDSPKKIKKKSSSNNSKYKSLSQEETAILEGENEYQSDDYQDHNISIDESVDISSGRMTRSKRRILARESKKGSQIQSDPNEEQLGRDDNSDSMAYDQKKEIAGNQEFTYQNSRPLEEEDEKEVEKEEEEISGSDNENVVSINKEYDIADRSKQIDLDREEELKNGKMSFTENNVKTELSEDYSSNDKEFAKAELARDRNTSEIQNGMKSPQKLVRNEKKTVEINHIDDIKDDDDDGDDDDDDDDDDDNTKDAYQSGSDDLNEFGDDSYNESETNPSDSPNRSLVVKKPEIKHRKNRRHKSRRNELVDESISSRTRRGNRSNRTRKLKVEMKRLKNGNSDATFNNIDEDSGSNMNSSFQTESSDDADYHLSENKEFEISEAAPQKINENASKEKLKKRSRKELIDNVSFDDERFKQILESPKKSKKLKISDKRYSPSPPIYDLSNQNIGDYEEDNIQFLENDIRPAIRNGPIIKPEQSTEKASTASLVLSTLNSGSQRKSNPKRSKLLNKSVGQNKSKKNNNNILDMSFDDSSNDIFDNDSGPFTFDIRNPLSKPSQNDIGENNNIEVTDTIYTDQESGIDFSKEEVENSPVNDVLPSDISVSSDIQNEVVSNKVYDEEVTESFKLFDLSKGDQDFSKVEDMEELSSQEIDDISPNREEVAIEDTYMDVEHAIDDKSSSLVNTTASVKDSTRVSKKSPRPLEDDSVILSDKPDIPTTISRSNKPLTDDSPLKDNVESLVVKSPQEKVQQSLEDTYQSTYNKEELLDNNNRYDKSDPNELSKVEKSYDVKVSPSTNDMEQNETSPTVNGSQQKIRSGRPGSQSAYDDYIQDMEEIKNGMRSSNAFSSPTRASTKAEQMDNSEGTVKINHTQIPVKQEVSSFLSGKEADSIAFEPDSDDDKSDNDRMVKKRVSKSFQARTSLNAIDRFSGNFANLLESSTPEKKEKPDLSHAPKELQGPLKWVPVSLSNLLDNLQNMEAASEYLNKSLNSKYDLHDDYDGELTNLISSMPEDEENMTIQEWVKHNATNCHKLAKQTCNEMIEAFRAESLRAIKTLEQMPTSD